MQIAIVCERTRRKQSGNQEKGISDGKHSYASHYIFFLSSEQVRRPDQEEDWLYPLLFTHLTRAKRSVEIITPYLVPNQGLIAALSTTARQGARVKILLPRHSDHPLVAAAGRSYYSELIESGDVVPHVSKVFPLAETLEALDLNEAGHTRGKIAIQVR